MSQLALDSGGPLQLYERLNENDDSDLSQYVDEVRQEVVGGINEGERGD